MDNATIAKGLLDKILDIDKYEMLLSCARANGEKISELSDLSRKSRKMYKAKTTQIYIDRIKSIAPVNSQMFSHVIAASDKMRFTKMSKLLRIAKYKEQG